MINVRFLNLKQIKNTQMYYSFNKYLLKSYYEPGSVLGSGDTAKKTKILSLWNLGHSNSTTFLS